MSQENVDIVRELYDQLGSSLLEAGPAARSSAVSTPEMLDTRYLRLLQGPADGRLRLAGGRIGVRFASNLGGRFLPAPTPGRCMGAPMSHGLRHTHQRQEPHVCHGRKVS